MEFTSIDLRKFKKIFFLVLIVNFIAVVISYIVVSGRFLILPGMGLSKAYTSPLLLIMAGLAIFHIQYQKKQLSRLENVTAFDEKLAQYEKIYRHRMTWYLFSCLLSCILYVFTARNLFLYFAIFDLITALPYYPNKILFQKELKYEEITP